jgi:hypothetical protein
VLEIIIAGAVVVLLIAGFWWTRGAGGVPGGVDDPAHQELTKYTPLGDRLPEAGAEGPDDRAHQVE